MVKMKSVSILLGVAMLGTMLPATALAQDDPASASPDVVTTTEAADDGLAAVLAELERLGGLVLELQARVDALEAGATPPDSDVTDSPKLKRPKAPRVKGKIRTAFPDWMADEYRPEEERSDERNRETVTWADRSDVEDGFDVYARRGFCALRKGADKDQALTAKDFRAGRGPATLIETLPADSTTYQPDHAAIDAALPEPPESEYSNDQFYDLYITAVNAAGESRPVLVGSYYLTPEFHCP